MSNLSDRSDAMLATFAYFVCGDENINISSLVMYDARAGEYQVG